MHCRGYQRRESGKLSGAEDNRQRKVAEPPTADERTRRPGRGRRRRLCPLARRRELGGTEADALDEGGSGGDEEEGRLRVLKKGSANYMYGEGEMLKLPNKSDLNTA